MQLYSFNLTLTRDSWSASGEKTDGAVNMSSLEAEECLGPKIQQRFPYIQCRENLSFLNLPASNPLCL